MSCVILLAADRPLPLRAATTKRTRTVSAGGHTLTVEEDGFSVREQEYYRDAVETLGLGLEMKPYRYELDVGATEQDAVLLRAYLEDHCAPGEQVELWNLWLGDDRETKVPSFRGQLMDLDREALEQLCSPHLQNGSPGQCRMTVTI